MKGSDLRCTKHFTMLFAIVFLCFYGSAFSQASIEKAGKEFSTVKGGKITGKVIDNETSLPMEYVNVSIFRKQDSRLVTGNITDVNGSFIIENLPFDTYFLEASFIGFEKMTVKDIIINSKSAIINLGTINLKASSQQMGTVEVVAERNRVEYKIDKKVINVTNDINASGGSAVSVLENTPSVDVDIDGNVSLRGSSNFTVLIDGRPSALSGSDALKQIPSSAIENIEIITNPSVKYDPDGMAGIINVVMKKNVISGLNGIVNMNVGTGDKYGADFLLNYKVKKYNLFVGGNWNDNTDNGKQYSSRESYSNDTTSYLITSGTRDQSRGGRQIKGGFDYYLNDNTSFTVSSEIGQFNFNNFGTVDIYKYQQPVTNDLYSVQKNSSERNGNFISADAGFLSKLNKEGTHKLEGSFDYRSRDGVSDEMLDENLSNSNFDTAGEYLSRVTSKENSKEDEYRIKLDYTLPLTKGSKFEAGLQSRIESENESLDFKDFNTETQQFENNPDFTSSSDFKESIHSVYSTYTGSFNVFQFVIGLRGEYNKRTTIHYKEGAPLDYSLDRFDLFPSAHLSYKLANEDQLMASYSRRINRPNGRDLDPFPSYINQYTIRTGNPGLKPEYTDSYEFNYMKRLGNSFISLETFYRTTNNLITDVQKQVDDILYLNVDNMNRDFSMGAEIMGNFSFNERLVINTSFSLYNYKLKGEISGESVDKHSTNYTGRLNATVRLAPQSRFQITGVLRGPTVSAQGNTKGDGYANLSFRQDFMKNKLSATLSVRDVLGTMRRSGTSSGDDFRSTFRMTREPRVLLLTLSYTLNNYKVSRESSGDESESSYGENE